MGKFSWRAATALSAVAVVSPLVSAVPATAAEQPPGIVINEAYLSGGSAGAAFKNKFVELRNTSAQDVDLSTWSLQYRAGTGTGATSTTVSLAGKSIKAGGYLLVAGGSNGTAGAGLPAADVQSGFNPSGTTGTIVLARKATALTLPSGSLTGNPDVADLLGYGTSNTFETKAAAAPSGNSDVRSLNRTGGKDTDDNSADFTLSATITPQNSASTGGGTDPGPDPGTGTDPAGVAAIADIQGTGTASPLAGKTVTTRGKVTAVYATGGFNGYYIQTPGSGGTAAGDRTSSDAIFVHSPATAGSVHRGDYVEVTGAVSEYFGLTQITVAAGGLTTLSDAAPEVKPTSFTLPLSDAAKEALEGMLVAPEGAFTVTDNYSLNQYGEIGLAAGTSALVQPTAVAAYGSDAYNAAVADSAARKVTLDDGASTNFMSAANKSQPLPYLTTTDPVRVGSPTTFTGDVVFDYRNSTWKLQPLEQLTPSNAAVVQPAHFENTRQAAPAEVGGNLTMATFNVQNYFPTTGDTLTGCTYYTDRAGNPITVNSGCDARGAANQENLLRQQAKIVAAINASGAGVISLEEIENSSKFGKNRDSALSILVDALNAAAPDTWAFVPSPAVVPAQEDVIRTAFIYRKAVAAPVGASVILDDAAFTGIARQPLAQAFKPVTGGDGTTFLAIVNHFKSKGSAATPDDTDKGQGASNLARTRQAQALVTFADTMKAAAKTDKVLLVGDFNAYQFEDPIKVLTDAGYIDQEARTGKHTYAFGGMVGSLDHVLASPAADAAVSGADVWNINAYESIALEYSRYNYNVTDYYVADQYRSSDHDPFVLGMNLATAPTEAALRLVNINDFHGRIDANTVKFAGTVEQLKAEAPGGNALFLSAGDNIGASLFASASQDDQPTLDVLNALEAKASAVGNHEFDMGSADLTGRVSSSAKFPYLGANVYQKGTTTPALPEYTVVQSGGLKVAVIGVVTQETPTLVSPGGVSSLDFGDPTDAVNRVAAKIKAENLADVIVAEYHEGAGAGTPDGATLEAEIAAGGPFAKLVTQTSADVAAIFTGHTHKEYTWDGPVPGQPGKTRPVLQTGNYGENVGMIDLTVDLATKQVTRYSQSNVKRSTAADASLVAAYPRVAAVKGIVDAALAEADQIGSQPIGKVTADVTTAFSGGKRDDRASSSTLGGLVADSLLATLKDASAGGAEIGVVNPGGLRAELYYAPDGTVTYAEANAVLPFVNNLWTTSLTGAQVKTMLEQQWQRDDAGNVPSRPYLQLGTSKNLTYTFDSTRPEGDRVTSVQVNGGPIDPQRTYRVGTFSFLAQGGDNFHVFKSGTDTRDSGLIDRDAWISYLAANSPVSPDFAKRSAEVTGAPSSVTPGQKLSVTVGQLDLTSLGSPVNSQVSLTYYPAAGEPVLVGTYGVTGGRAVLDFTVPEFPQGGTYVVSALESKTAVALPISVPVVDQPAPVPASAQCAALGKSLDDPGNRSAKAVEALTRNYARLCH
ncbi:ExeM/NucH family extracellular endonuclease [Sinomonas atrocyanea]|uniref:ExeM/NucH family extracellular endonuclease n=1 Tax=Sinomonas atrocyanea TaxID=37927 RepID=UPI00278B66D6|nr:ExeM/NucH family extracellular endonuclease [Sinomonas atrocyanea]MDQ0260958.1 5'-nucleotidase [Sinomonas atrocyanea]MDR6622087.1 5'-nucleotidase [Sinomonas atrocyanea]